MDSELKEQFNLLHKNIAILNRQVERINRLLSEQRKSKVKEDKWLTCDAVKLLTGWDTRLIEKLRLQGLIKVKREGKASVKYLLSSVEELKSKLPK
jgi:hypothetical protein